MSRIGKCFDLLRGRGILAQVLFFASIAAPLHALPAPWPSVGPAGGDARSLADVPGDPRHLYLGTTDSWVYESTDEGATWHRLSRLQAADSPAASEGLVIDSLIVDSAHPATLYAGAYMPDRPEGGLWVSRDAGRTWTQSPGLHDQSIHALAQAPSNPAILFAGTLQGIFRSNDAGASWALISPAASREIHEVESLAVDPTNPDVLYAGTWHLPWKTTDGGKTWHNIKEGLIDDSDVFSIIVDPVKPKTVFLSACSGIYKSETAGEKFHKIQGIPATARRTRVLMQDPKNRLVVYAGTTEGLYKTTDGGKTFQRMTGPDVIVNDVFVDPNDTSRVLLATDRSGVLASEDSAATFADSNRGFSQRKVEALFVDRSDPTHLFAGVVNDKTYGGVFASTDEGLSWKQLGEGLEGRDVFALTQSQDGTLLAGTSHGIFALAAAAPDAPAAWQPRNTVANTVAKDHVETHLGKKVNIEKMVDAPLIELESRVFSLDASSDVWLASTAYGLVTSKDKGATWQGGPVMGSGGYLSVAVHGPVMAAATSGTVVLSKDAGQSWWPLGLPTMLTRIHRIAFSRDGTLWLGAREGVYFTRDLGKTWLWIERLPFRDVDDLSLDEAGARVLVCSQETDQVYSIDPKTMKWTFWQTGYRIGLIRAAGSHLVAASLNDGVLVQPQPAQSEHALPQPAQAAAGKP